MHSCIIKEYQYVHNIHLFTLAADADVDMYKHMHSLLHIVKWKIYMLEALTL